MSALCVEKSTQELSSIAMPLASSLRGAPQWAEVIWYKRCITFKIIEWAAFKQILDGCVCVCVCVCVCISVGGGTFSIFVKEK